MILILNILEISSVADFLAINLLEYAYLPCLFYSLCFLRI